MGTLLACLSSEDDGASTDRKDKRRRRVRAAQLRQLLQLQLLSVAVALQAAPLDDAAVDLALGI